MAKKSKVPSGVAGMTETEVMEMVQKSPNSPAMKQLIEQLRAQNAANKATQSNTSANTESKSKVIADNQAKSRIETQNKKTEDVNNKILESDNSLIKVEEKLTSVVEKLIGVFEKSLTKGVGPVTPTARAQELVDSKKLDYRTIGQRFKDKIFGRGGTDQDGKRLGNAFDPNSLRYKFTTMKGLAETTGLVKQDSKGFIANALAKREERKQTAEEMKNLNPQMKNLDQFQIKDPITGKRDTSPAALKASEQKVKEYYEKESGKAQTATGNLQDKEAVLNKARAAGIAEDEITRTVGGKQALEARNTAADEVIKLDPRMRGEKHDNETVRKVRQAEIDREVTPKKVVKEDLSPFAGPAARLATEEKPNAENAAENQRQMDEQTDLLKQIEANTRSDSVKKDNKKKDKDSEDKEDSKGGVLSRMKDKAASFLEKKGLLPKGLKSAGSSIMKGGKGLLGKGAGLLRGASALGGAASAAGGAATAAGGAAAAG
jgi:hypothetical protein